MRSEAVAKGFTLANDEIVLVDAAEHIAFAKRS
jgi:hypothetical protein